MAWLVLIVSGMLEAVWATAMSQSNGFSRLWPSIVFVIGVVLSMGGLAIALKSIPVGTGYAVWVGVGAVTTAAWAMARGAEPVSTLKIVFLAGIIVCIVGLQLVSSGEAH
ncbi:MAG: multidrug efflux SMR transporter [Thermomicrobiales bacterium]|nr:multidrug efflux SMR transporter [Thermomicrobiales bacterium]